MKKITRIIAVALCGVILTGCNNLDTEPYGSTITSEQKAAVAEANPDILEASVNGVMTMFSVYLNAISSSSTYHNDYGYGSLMLFLDCRGADMVSQAIGYNWYSASVTYADITSTSVLPTYAWNTMYNQIYTANSVLSTVYVDNEAPTDETLMYYCAQALAVRAFDYFVLAQLYQFNYVGNESKACVPLVLHTNSDELASAGGGCRSTVKEVYDQILEDLGVAIDLLENTSVTRASGRSGKAFVSAAVAHGLRARVYLAMQEYSKALEDVEYAIENSGAYPYTMDEVSVPNFATSEHSSWLWAINIEESDRVVTSGIINWPSHLGSLNYGYAAEAAWRAGIKAMIDAIPDTDVRKGWWLGEDGTSPNLNAEQQAYVDGAGMDDYTQVKFAPYEDEIYTSTNANDIPLMRIEELYLLKAEAQAMSGSPAAGAATLQEFVRTYRDPSYTCTASTASDVQEEVLFQRRVELWGEGHSWFDLMRLNKGVDRRGANWQAAYTYNISANDPVLILQIPNAEMQANPNIGSQNTAGTTPQPVTE